MHYQSCGTVPPHLEQERGDHVHALAVADARVVDGEGPEHTAQAVPLDLAGQAVLAGLRRSTAKKPQRLTIIPAYYDTIKRVQSTTA
jgi:hypothetical protein